MAPLALGLLGAGALLAVNSQKATADGTFIPAPDRVDMVYDLKRDTLYIARKRVEFAPGGNTVRESEVLRYQVGTRTFLDPIPLAGDLGGMDLSPDGDTLLVADAGHEQTKIWVYQVNLTDLSFRKAAVSRLDHYEGGTYSLAFGNDGAALVTTFYQGSGRTPLRRYDPDTGAWSSLGEFSSSTVTASPDGSVIGIAEGNSSDGPWGRYRVLDGDLVRRRGYQNGTSWSNHVIGVQNGGTQYTLPTYNGAYVYNASYGLQGIVGQYASDQPVGVAYHPFDRLVYYAWGNGSHNSPWVRAHRTTDLQPIAEYDFESPFDHVGNAFEAGRLRLARDGSYLFAMVEGGIRFVQLAEHRPVAAELTVRAQKNAPTPLPRASYSPTGTLSYEVVQTPRHGTLSGTAPDLIYTPARGFNGPDRFTYRVNDGAGLSNIANVNLLVGNLNSAPVAGDDAATTTGKPVIIKVLENDTDPDGDKLKIVAVAAPQHGRVKKSGRTVRYTPVAGGPGVDQFVYLVTDSKGHTATATVTVQLGGSQ